MSIPVNVTVKKYQFTDAEDVLLEGATVRLMDSWSSRINGGTGTTATTDENGEATVNIPAPFRYTLAVHVVGSSILNVNNMDWYVVYNLEMKKGDYVEIDYDDDTTLKTYLAADPDYDNDRLTITDPLAKNCTTNNAIRIYPASEWMVSVELDGYAKNFETFRVRNTSSVDVEIRLHELCDTPFGNMKYGDTIVGLGSVSWNGSSWDKPGSSEEAIEGAYVVIYGENGRCSVTTTDENGYFEFSDLAGNYSGGRYWIYAYKFDYYKIGRKVYSVRGLGPHFLLFENTVNEFPYLWRMPHWNGYFTQILGNYDYTEAESGDNHPTTEYTISGRIYHNDGRPFTKTASVYIRGDKYNGEVRQYDSAVTAPPNSAFSFTVTKGKYQVFCQRPEYDMIPASGVRSVVIIGENVGNVDFYLTERETTEYYLCAVAGDVYELNEKTGVFDVAPDTVDVSVTLIHIDSGFQETDDSLYREEGGAYYEINYLPAGVYTLFVTAPGYRARPRVTTFTLEAGETYYLPIYLVAPDVPVPSFKVWFADVTDGYTTKDPTLYPKLSSGVRFELETRDVEISGGAMTGDPNSGETVSTEYTDTWDSDDWHKRIEDIDAGVYFFTFPGKNYQIVASSLSSDTVPADMIELRAFNIISADATAKTFTILGDYTDEFTADTLFDTINAGANDGTYKVTSASYDGTNTVITINSGYYDMGEDNEKGALCLKESIVLYVRELHEITLPVATPVQVNVETTSEVDVPTPIDDEDSVITAPVDEEGVAVVNVPDGEHTLSLEADTGDGEGGGSGAAPIGGQVISTKYISGYAK